MGKELIEGQTTFRWNGVTRITIKGGTGCERIKKKGERSRYEENQTPHPRHLYKGIN